MHIHASVDLGIFAATLAVIAAYGLVTLITVGIEAGARVVDAALHDEPALGAPAPHDEGDGCWLPCGLAIDITPAAGDGEARFTR